MAKVANEPPPLSYVGSADSADVSADVESLSKTARLHDAPRPPSPNALLELGSKKGKTKHRLLSRAATQEVRGYRTLNLAESAYENAFLMRVITKSVLGKAHLLFVNFFLQYSVVYLLSRRTTGNQSAFQTALFGASSAVQAPGLCWQDSPSSTKISCTPDEVSLSADFGNLDINGDGRWTFAEAQELSTVHLQRTQRHVNLTQFYKNVFHTMQQHAGPRITKCSLNEDIQALDHDKGFWSDAKIGNITSDGNVVVNYVDPTKQASWARYLPTSVLRKQIDGTMYACSVPKCVDMDSGATDSTELACSGYNGFDACAGTWDDDDFNVQQMCCNCGGGSSSLTLAGIGHLPVDIPLEDITNLRAYRSCMQGAELLTQQDECIVNFTSIPRRIYDDEIARFANFCFLPESDLCGNLANRQLLPQILFNISSSVPMFLKITGISSLTALTTNNVCEKTVSSFCHRIYTVQSTLFQEQRTDICGKKSSQIVGDKKTTRYLASSTYKDPTFGLTSLLFQGFLFLIVFLWGLASLTEFRNILVWWNVVSSLPAKDADDCLIFHTEDGAEDDDAVLEIVGLTRAHRIVTVLVNLGPRTILQCCIFVVGIQYLLSVRNVSDLILNSLALTFLVTVDEMLFAAFAGEQNACWIQNSKPLRGRSFRWLDWLLARTHLPMGMLIFLPVLATLMYFVISNKVLTDQLALATYCLCDLEGEHCVAPQFLSQAAGR